ncbi:hypothetical protein COMA2_160052 [Candidatus Nitrospira nitrificans]|uniref:Uncharacterized protein n=1 Tax=Candidatus Nitrospira nitrificans TaxID=1742973 RepID=A0A0S4LGH6_9BACT|nr:hypothetical protein COMA2_160052 [Candidatus Nitrospira nitrificans]
MFAEVTFERYRKSTRRERFLDERNRVVSWRIGRRNCAVLSQGRIGLDVLTQFESLLLSVRGTSMRTLSLERGGGAGE